MFSKVLFIDDDPKILKDVAELLQGSKTNNYQIEKVDTGDFQKGMNLLKSEEYDLVVLDLCKGEPAPESEKIGEDILKEIQSKVFVPVIFFTGLPGHVEDLSSHMIRVVNKGEGIEALESEITFIAKSGMIPLKKQIFGITQESLRYFFWEFVHQKKDIIDQIKDEISLGYLLLRRLAHSLSKEQIRELLNDDKILEGKAHPMEFYIYPNDEGEYECGEILQKGEEIFIILTPTCDFVQSENRPRKAEKVLLAAANALEKTKEYQKYLDNPVKFKQSLSSLIESRKGDRYFFLPGTPFISNYVIDFQDKLMMSYDDLKGYTRIAKLDDPFVQSMISTFTRYYNRIGFPDLDSEYILSQITPAKP